MLTERSIKTLFRPFGSILVRIIDYMNNGPVVVKLINKPSDIGRELLQREEMEYCFFVGIYF